MARKPQPTLATGEIDKQLARATLFEEAAKAMGGYVDASWVKPIERISTEAETAKSLTHIAFIGTAMLARCLWPAVDVFAVKERAGPNAYSARGLCHGVLVPNAPELDISLGVTGREPLNNLTYMRLDRLTRDAPVRSTARPVLGLVCDLLDRLQGASDEQARQALRAFIDVRRRFGTRYARSVVDRIVIGVPALVSAIEQLAAAGSEGGRVAQAMVAGLMDVVTTPARVDVRRVNDPSRSTPADVNVRTADDNGWERAFEVRDKPVSREDLYLLVGKCLASGVGDAVMVAIAPSPALSLLDEARAWAAERGVALSVFTDWSALVTQALHWAPTPTLEAAGLLPGRVEQRLIEAEASDEALALWRSLVGVPG
jgi:hypothetical protein